MMRSILIVIVCLLGGWGPQPTSAIPQNAIATTGSISGDHRMQLGNFSVSLAVKDIAASRAFYEKLGFKQVARPGTELVDPSELNRHHRTLSGAAIHQEHADVQSRVG